MALEIIGLNEPEVQDNRVEVTRLAPGVRDPNRVNVFLAGKFAFSLDVAQVVEFGLKIGQRLDDSQVAELRQASEFGKLYQRALEWALTRPHSIREARDYLRRKSLRRQALNRERVRQEKKPIAEIDEKVSELVLTRLIEKGYLDDRKFAEFYVENRHTRRGISQRRLRYELAEKGVAEATITAALERAERPEAEELAKLIAKKRARYNDEKLLAYLVRQGFSYQQAKDAIAAQVCSQTQNPAPGTD